MSKKIIIVLSLVGFIISVTSGVALVTLIINPTFARFLFGETFSVQFNIMSNRANSAIKMDNEDTEGNIIDTVLIADIIEYDTQCSSIFSHNTGRVPARCGY